MPSREDRDRSPPGLLASKADGGILQSVEEANEKSPAGREDRTTEQAFMDSPD
jgi:hypothetical protein